MIIGIDGKPLTIPYPNGLKHYAQNLVINLLSIDKKNIYIIFSPEPLNLPGQNNFVNITPPKLLSKVPWQIILPILSIFHRTDIFHLLQQHGSILLKHQKTVTTVHDLADERAYPSWRESIFYFMLSKYVLRVRERILNKSHFFITVSQSARTELINHGITKPIYVVYNGVDCSFLKKNSIKCIKQNYILTMTDFSPRKNIVRILQAYALLPDKIRNQYYLHIVISTEYPQKKILSLAKKFRISHNIIFHHNPPNDEIMALYRSALVFLYPSLYEGFGLPILEAMACGCPVVTSNYGATKEIAGGAAYLVDPKSVEDIHTAMKTFIKNPQLREYCQFKGYKRIKSFPWKRTAKETLKIYEKIYQEKA